MAVAGLRNVSILESPFLRESQSEVMKRRGDGQRARTRASSLLQMWRELEDEHVVNRSSKRVPQHRGDGLSSDESRVDVSDGHESEHSCISEELSVRENDFGSESGHDDSSDMGDIERERVRQIFREWRSCAARERTSSVSRRNNGPRAKQLGENEQEREWVQRRSTFLQRGEDQGTQIERLVNGSVVNLCNEGHLEHIQRGFRRICGRQALIDMLNKAERERQQELQGLLECRAVSQFSHRNRIQSLLRGRFLRNDRAVDNKRPTSTAANELGFLRQRHTVSGLREEFLSRLDSSCSRASSSISDTSSNSDINGNENNKIQANNMQMAVDEFHEQTDSSIGLPDERTDIGSDIVEDRSLQEPSSRSEGGSGQVPEDEFRRRAQSANIELVQNRDRAEHVNDNGMNEDSPSSFVSNRVDELEGGAFESVDQHQSSTRVEEWEGQALETDNTGLVEGDLGTNDWRDESQSNEWLESEEIEMWHEDYGFQGPEQGWVDVELPSEQSAVPALRMDPFYLPDEDNDRSVELGELLSRRSVSTLLGSGFRESLDQIVRSYVERQSHGPLDWDQSEEQSQLGLSSSSMPPMQQLWDQEPQKPYGMEWDIINDMRVDMARLQQRMNNMQRMLEACMDMQLELQRSIRQEVSAALNRPSSSNAVGENDLAENRSKWDCVRKGICCMCSESGIDSLLYRCGHMCTCSKCANGLVQKGEKCPMCKAPVVEVIRAYSGL